MTPPNPVDIRLDNSSAHDARRTVNVVDIGKRFGEDLSPRHMH